MARIPVGWKRRLLPIWNGGHRLAWRVGDYAEAIRNRRFEHCIVCGRAGPILYRRWIIPPRLEELWGLSPRVAEALARKESSQCAWCGASLRARRLALVLLETYPVGTPPAPAHSVVEWARHPEARALRVAEINLIEGLHAALRGLPGHIASDYQEGPGAGGLASEDLTRLTYPDAAFELILTSETLEHVPDFGLALRELHRVLAPGGRHLFTVPLMPGVPETFARTVILPDGRLDHRAPPLFHPGGDVGYRVFTEFGADLPVLLHRAGFEVTIHFGPTTEDDLAQVFDCRKPPASA